MGKFFTKDELNKVLENHLHWFNKDCDGWSKLKADLRGAKNVPFISMACPDTGEFIGWKKCKLGTGEGAEYCVVKLRIPKDAKRSSATGRKCRCDKAEVLYIESIDGSVVYTEARSDHDYEFVYKVGETVSVDNFDENRFKECAPGIHFFINRQEAVGYTF